MEAKEEIKEVQKTPPRNSHMFHDAKGVTIIQELLDGSEPKGTLHLHRGNRTIDFVMTKWPMYKAITMDYDYDFVKNEISMEGFADIDWQMKGHPVYDGKTYLIFAVCCGKLDFVTLLLDHGADPNLVDDYGLTALNYAIERNHKHIFEVLVNNPKTNVNLVVEGIDPPLQMCVIQNKKDWAQILVDKGADINLHTNDTPSPLCFSLAEGNADCAKWLIELGADINIAFDGITPMCFAAKKGLVEIMGLLLERGAVISRGEYATTPLHVATLNNQVEAVKFLLDKGADVNVEQDSTQYGGETPIMLAAQFPEIFDLLMAHNAKIDVSRPREFLSRAASGGSVKMLKMFIEKYNMDVNTRNEHDATLLFNAASVYAKDSENKAEHLEELIRLGINVNATESQQGVSALLIAVENRRTENVKALLKAGANPNLQDHEGMTPLHMACGHCMSEIIELLVEAGGDLELKNAVGETPNDLRGPKGMRVIPIN